jgi:hypothetical protein
MIVVIYSAKLANKPSRLDQREIVLHLFPRYSDEKRLYVDAPPGAFYCNEQFTMD